MSVYVDTLQVCIKTRKWRWGKSCHLFADTLEELHSFAIGKLAMKQEWFQNHTRLPHYDLTEGRRRVAVLLGAIEVGREVVVAHMAPRQQVKR